MKKRHHILFEEKGKGKICIYNFKMVLEELESIQIGIINIKGLKIQSLSPLTELQKRILKLLNVEIKLDKKVIN